MAFSELTMRSTILKMDVKVTVIIPENRRDYHLDPVGKKYPCLYILHGTSEDNSTWMNSSNIYLLARDMDLFVVMVSAYNSCYVNTKYGFRMQDYLAKELPAKMERLFPISSRREDRFIMGESMGGYGTWLTSLTHPDKYAKAVPLSTTGFRNIKHVLDTGAHSVDQLAIEVNNTCKNPTEYLAMCGTDDMLYPKAVEWEEWMKQNCPNIKLQTYYCPGKHDFFFWNKVIPRALEFFGFSIDPERIAQI